MRKAQAFSGKKEYISCERIDDERALGVMEKRIREQELSMSRFRKKLTGKYCTFSPSINVMPEIPTEKLGDVLTEYEIELRELFSEEALEYASLDGEDKAFAELCDALGEEKLEILSSFMEKLCANKGMYAIAKTIYRAENTPTTRAVRVYVMRTKRGMRAKAQEIPESLQRAYKNALRTKISFDDMPRIAKYLDVSLHWLLGLDERVRFYGKRGTTDVLYGKYKLLEKDERAAVDRMVSELSDRAEDGE